MWHDRRSYGLPRPLCHFPPVWPNSSGMRGMRAFLASALSYALNQVALPYALNQVACSAASRLLCCLLLLLVLCRAK